MSIIVDFIKTQNELSMKANQIKTKKPPLYLNLSDFKLIVELIDQIEGFLIATNHTPHDKLSSKEIQLRLKIQTIISYIERARLRSRGDFLTNSRMISSISSKRNGD